MKNDDEINESSISDLIHYAEDEKRNTFDDEPETDDELDDEITETDDETVSDKEKTVSEEISEETEEIKEEPISEEIDEEPKENNSEEEKTLSNNVNYDDDTDYPDYEMDVGFFDDLKIGDHKGIIIGVIIGIIVVIAFITIDTGICCEVNTAFVFKQIGLVRVILIRIMLAGYYFTIFRIQLDGTQTCSMKYPPNIIRFIIFYIAYREIKTFYFPCGYPARCRLRAFVF